MATRIRLRYDTEANWLDTNAAGLAPGEFGVALKSGGEIEVRVGNADPATNTLVPWTDAPQISASGIPGGGTLDFTDAVLGDILYYDGTEWTSASLISRFDVAASAQNNIGVEEDGNGVITLKYITFTFNPTFVINESPTTLEVRELYNTALLGSTFTVTPTAGGSDNVSVSSATFSNSTGNYDQTFNVSLTMGQANNIPLSTIDADSSWGANINNFVLSNAATRRDRFQVVFVPDTSGGYSGGNRTVTRDLLYGWRILMLTSDTLYTTASAFQTAYDNSSPGDFTEYSDQIVAPTGTTFTEKTFNITNSSGGDLYVYFVHSCNISGGSDTFGWTPTFKDPNNLVEQFTDIAPTAGIEYDTAGFEYKVHLWGTTSSPNVIGNGSTATLKVS